MIKNTASQYIAFHMLSTSDGSDVTSGTPTVYVTKDGGTQGTGSGTATHEGNGEWSYAPTQAETNADHVAFTMVLSGAYSVTLNVYPSVVDYRTDFVTTALQTLGLDHLISASVTGTDVVDNSIIAKLVSKSATADWDSFDNTTDSLEGIADGTGATQAQVLTKCQEALQTYHLDHFMAAACTAGNVVDNSLAAKMISKAATATFSGYDNTTDSQEAIRDRGDSAWTTGANTTAGTGAYVVTVHVDDDAAADLENATVRCVDNNGAGATVNTLLTDSNGDAVFALDAGTWQISISKSGYQGEVNSGVVISGSTTLTYDIDGSSITASAAGLSTGHMTCYDEDGAVESGVTISIQCVKAPSGSTGLSADNKVRTTTSNGSGYVEFTNLLQGFTYEVWRGTSTDADVNGTAVGGKQEFVVPTTSPFEMTTVIGNDE